MTMDTVGDRSTREVDPAADAVPEFGELIQRARAQAFENLYDAVVVTDMEGRIVDWNRGSERLYGYSRAEILGRPVNLLHLPEEGAKLMAEVLESVEREGRWQGQAGLLRKDGSRGWIESSVVPLFDEAGAPIGALGVNRDISDRVAAEEELRLAEAKFRSLVEHSLVGIHIIQDERFVYVNPRFAEIVGYTAEELTSGMRVRDLVHEADRALALGNLSKRLSGEDLEEGYAFRGRRKDGEVIHVEVHGARIELGGEPAVIGMIRDITEEHLAEERLRDSEERYRLVVQASADVFRDWDVATGSLAWGPTAPGTFHYPPEALGDTVEWWSNRIHPDDRLRVVRGLYAVLEGGGGSWSEEYRFRRGDGDYTLVLDRASVVRSATGAPTRVMSSMHDVTERRRSEEAEAFLARASAALDSSLEEAPTLANLARIAVPFLGECCLVDMIGEEGEHHREQVVCTDSALRSRLEAEVPFRDTEGRDAIAEVIRTGEPALLRDLDGEGRTAAPAGEHRSPPIASVIVVPIVARGRVLGTLTLGASSLRRQYTAVDLGVAENLASRAGQALDNVRLYREARAASDARTRLFADVSHEFRTPLMLSLGPLDDLAEGLHGPLPEAHREQIELARRSARRLLELTNQILDLARLEAGRMPMRPEEVELGGLVEEVATRFEPLAKRRGIILQVGRPSEPLVVMGDPAYLERVVNNLLSNAHKYAPDGATIGVRARREDGRALIQVMDSGPGIPADEAGRIFDRFYRLEGTVGRIAGTGIGLALARELVELHGGTISVESSEGTGSTFTVALPLESQRSAPPATDLPASVPDPAPSNGSSEPVRVEPAGLGADVTTILVVEDDAELRAYLCGHLRQRYRVLEAVNGEEAIEQVRSRLPDLVISDVAMPGMDGYALCRAIRQDPETDFIPVVLLTGRAAPEDRLAGFHEEADDYITKPFRPEELLTRIANLISSRKRLRERFRQPPLVLHSKPVDVASADESYMEAVRSAIEEHLDDEDYTVVRLASDLAQSRSQMYRRLRELVGESPSALIRRLRLERAAQLLEAGAGSVSSIAYSVGFKSVSHFSNAFQHEYGVRPSQYGSRAIR